MEHHHHSYKIFHPTDYSKHSRYAFLHALKIALAMQGRLEIAHVDPIHSEPSWDAVPTSEEAAF